MRGRMPPIQDMFVGHLAVAFAAKRTAPTVNLAWLVAGVTTLDLVWPLFVLAGIEHVRIVPGTTAFTPLVFDSYPWSHSLLMAGAWGLVVAGLARWRGMGSASGLLVALVVSHWVLDYVSHAPDMPLWPGSSPHVGLGLWNSVAWTFVVEGAMWLAGIVVYLRIQPPRGWKSRLAFWSLVAVTTVLWASGPWSPPPPNTKALGWFALIGWIVVPWAAFVERVKPQGALAQQTNGANAEPSLDQGDTSA